MGPGVHGDEGDGLAILGHRLGRLVAPVEGKIDQGGVTILRGGRVLDEAEAGADVPKLKVGVDGAAAVARHPVSDLLLGVVPTHLINKDNLPKLIYLLTISG